MKKLLLFAIAGIIGLGTSQAQSNIATARGMAVGSNVTIVGVAGNGSELGVIRYIQDISGGLPAYGGTLSAINKGDSVSITGTLKLYQNLLELDPIISFSVISTNRQLPPIPVVTPNQLSETNEGSLLKVKNCKFSTTGTFGSNATNYTVTSGAQTFVVRSNTLVGGTPIPSGTVDITGLNSQYCTSPTTGCTTGYQFLIRTSSDMVASTSTVTGISEANENAFVSVFPNPAGNVINFRLNNNEIPQSVKITDISGRIVYSASGILTSVNVDQLSKGLYTISIATTAGSEYRGRFVKE